MQTLRIALEKPIVFYPQLAKALGGINEALFWQQCYYWSDKTKRTDGFFYKTQEEFTKEISLSDYQQKRIRTKLVELGVLHEKRIKANGAPTIHYMVDVEAMQKILDVQFRKIRNSSSEKLGIPITENTNRDLVPNGTDADAPHQKQNENKSSHSDSGEPTEQAAADPAAAPTTKKLFYDVTKAYRLPITNHSHISKWCKDLDTTFGEQKSKKYLNLLLARNLNQEREQNQFVPTLNTPFDIVAKAMKIVHYYRNSLPVKPANDMSAILERERIQEEEAERIRNGGDFNDEKN